MPSMPAAIVIIACKVAFLPHASPIDEANSSYTGHRPYEWAIEHSQMQCRRHEVSLYNPADPNAEFNAITCTKASMQVRFGWDMSHRNSNWRVWKTGCPVPTINTQTGDVLAWTLPSCPRKDNQGRVTVHCENDTAI